MSYFRTALSVWNPVICSSMIYPVQYYIIPLFRDHINVTSQPSLCTCIQQRGKLLELKPCPVCYTSCTTSMLVPVILKMNAFREYWDQSFSFWSVLSRKQPKADQAALLKVWLVVNFKNTRFFVLLRDWRLKKLVSEALARGKLSFNTDWKND